MMYGIYPATDSYGGFKVGDLVKVRSEYCQPCNKGVVYKIVKIVGDLCQMEIDGYDGVKSPETCPLSCLQKKEK